MLHCDIQDAVTGFPKTCSDVKQSGGQDGYHALDPEHDGLDPISVCCNMSSTPATAMLHHSREDWTYVSGHEERRSYNVSIVITTKECTTNAHV